jgi:threonine/homoserine/homoserine lactone efflux protein
MLEIILQGILTGFIVSLSFGAGFFSLIQTSIKRGIYRAMYISFGVIASDTIFILFSVFSTAFISHELIKYEHQIRIGGMIVLVAMGIYSLIKHSRVSSSALNDDPHVMYYVSKGFLINTFNPINALTWIGVAVFLESALQYSMQEIVVYFGLVLCSIFGTQMLVVYSANKLKDWLSEKIVHRFNIIVGITFIALGIFIYFNKSDPTKETPIEKAQHIMGD